LILNRAAPTPRRFTPRAWRVRFAWSLALPFLLLAEPSPRRLVLGAALSLAGLVLRAAAAGSIHKERSLAVGGPYAHLRHPLYLGSFLAGLGLALAGGRWFLLPAFLAVFLWTYGQAIRQENRTLERLFGESYRHYRREVRGFIPRLRPYGPPPGKEGREPGQVSAEGPGLGLYLRNKEWKAVLGTTAGFGLLWAKVMLTGS
jgi:hypothetical protein